MDKEKVARLVEELLREIGEDPGREGLVDTPKRVAEAYRFLTGGYAMDLKEVINGAVFESEVNNMIICKDIEAYSLCEHHMLPFFGVCHIGYVARKKVLGLSKLARIVDYYARRLQIQERLTAQIARTVKDEVDAEGVGVVMECRHMCMMMRGVQKQNSSMVTSTVLGSFHESAATRGEFMNLIGKKF